MASSTPSETALPATMPDAVKRDLILRSLNLVASLHDPEYMKGKSTEHVLADAFRRLGAGLVNEIPQPFRSSSEQNAIRGSNATETGRSNKSWEDRVRQSGIHLLRDMLLGAISREADLVLDEQGNLPDSMPPREWKQLFLEGYKFRCKVNEVPRRVVEEYDEFMKARNSRRQNDKSTGKEWTFGEMCQAADPVGKVIGWKARLPLTEEQPQPPIPSLPCADYSFCHPVAIIGRPGQHSVCDCKNDCKFRDNPTELRTVALGLVCCNASSQGVECSCLKDPSGGGKGVYVRVYKPLKHGQTHPREGGGADRTTKNLLHNSSGEVLTVPLAEYDEIWCPSQLVVQITETRFLELKPKKGRRKAKDNAEEDTPPDEEDTPPDEEDTPPEVEATRRSQRRRIENSRYPEYDMHEENV